jgi:hypothetical protein
MLNKTETDFPPACHCEPEYPRARQSVFCFIKSTFLVITMLASLLFVPAALAGTINVAPAPPNLPVGGQATAATTTFTGLNRGLVGYWTMDGKDINWTTNKIIDRSGYGNTGTLVGLGKATSSTLGKVGQAMKFDGGVSKVTTTSLLSNMPTQKLSVTVWAKVSSSVNYADVVGGGDTGNYGWEVRTVVGKFCAKVGNGSSLAYKCSVVYPLNSWHQVGVVYDGQTMNLYVDGKYVDSGSLTGPINFTDGLGCNNKTIIIGQNPCGSGVQNFSGLIDDVRIYNRALSAAEVKQLYNQGAGSKVSVAPAPPNLPVGGQATAATTTFTGLNRGLVGYWTMDGKDINWTSATAGTIRDRSGNGNTGTFTSFVKSKAVFSGKIGQAFNFINGTAPCVPISNNQSLNPLVNNYSVAAWIKPANLSGMHSIFASNDAGKGFEFRTEGNGLAFTTRAVKDYPSTTITLATSTWAHVTFIFDSSNDVSFYVNGVYRETVNGTNPGIVATSYSLGCRTDLGRYFNGSLDDVRVYNRALSAAEIKQLYDQGSGSKLSVAPAPPNLPIGGQATAATSTFTGLNKGLVGYWTMDGKDINWTNNTMVDRSGNGNTGTLVGLAKATSSVSGRIGQAMKFQKPLSCISLGNNSSLNPTNAITGSFWFKPIPDGSYQYLLTRNDNANSRSYEFSINTLNKLQIQINGNSIVKEFGSTLLPNKWYHAVFTYSSSTLLSTYVNGQLAATNTSVGALAVSTQTGAIGCATVGSPNHFPFKGTIDDVRVYNRALSAGEVKQLYNMGR